MLASVSIEQQNEARAVLHAFVAHFFLYAAPEKTLAALARSYAVVKAGRFVAAYLAQVNRVFAFI